VTVGHRLESIMKRASQIDHNQTDPLSSTGEFAGDRPTERLLLFNIHQHPKVPKPGDLSRALLQLKSCRRRLNVAFARRPFSWCSLRFFGSLIH
jgi:hypothetical protein